MLQILSDKGIPTLLAGIRPLRDLGPEYNVRFQSLFSNLADRYDAAFYADYLEGVAGKPEFLQKDGLVITSYSIHYTKLYESVSHPGTNWALPRRCLAGA